MASLCEEFDKFDGEAMGGGAQARLHQIAEDLVRAHAPQG